MSGAMPSARAGDPSDRSPQAVSGKAAIPIAIGERLLAAVGSVESFARNWAWRSHSPVERAKSALSEATAAIGAGAAYLESLGAGAEQVEEWTSRAIRLWRAYQDAGGRTANPMITGPARFPVEKNRRAMETERKRGEEYFAFVDGAKPWFARQERRQEKAELSAAAATVEHRSLDFPGVRLVQNEPLNRIQLLFDGKPVPETIKLLKGEAFRWSPREGAWQRQNTNNGVQAAYRVLRALGHERATSAQGGVTEGRDGEAGSVSEANSTRSDEGGCAQTTGETP